MKSDHQHFLDMCKRVKKIYRSNETKLGHVKGLGQMFAQLNLMSTKLELEFENTISFNHSYTIENARKREILQQECHTMGMHIARIKEIARYNTGRELSSFIALEPQELGLLDDDELISFASGLYDLCLASESRLKTAGVYRKAIEGFAKKLTLFALDYPQLQYTVEKRKRSHLQCLKLIFDINICFKEKLDPYFETLSKSQPHLYKSYFAARVIQAPDYEGKADFEGIIEGEEPATVFTSQYDKDREFMVQVQGGNAIWGLCKKPGYIQYGLPANETQRMRISSRLIGPSGNYLAIQALRQGQHLYYKVWVMH